MPFRPILDRYSDLQRYVGWSDDDARRVAQAGRIVAPHFPALIDDFYREIERHPAAAQVITGGPEQVTRLKGLLHRWIGELFSGPYDADYVTRRWQVGLRHAEIGLDQVYTNAALSRLRLGMLGILRNCWDGDPHELFLTIESLLRLLDLDLAIIEDAYQSEFALRQQRNERLAAIGQMGGGIAHELRNPLNVIKTSVYYLIHARNPSQEKVAEHLQRIERQVGLADSVITALSDFARMPAPRCVPSPAEPLLREVVETTPIASNILIAWDLPADLPPLFGDRGQLLVVFGNLVRNGREAMTSGGTLTLAGRSSESFVEVTVADTGTGIAPRDLARVMEPLYSTKTRGIGLGLAIVRTIVRNHGGELLVDSEPEHGARFHVRLPLAPAGE